MASLPQENIRSAEPALAREVSRRRTFAIISHPDAGKTTLTEKLLLYAGAVDLAGAVRARKTHRSVTSDWMAMERERGISVTAAALEIEYQGYRVNLLDTPGHQDFSEDTYRTLMAVDSAVMVLDASKGIEAQTEMLFRVCKMRGIPILTFINKMDLPARDPLELLDQIEQMLGIATTPFNWPIGEGNRFKGVYDLRNDQVLSYERTVRNERRAALKVTGLDDPTLEESLGETLTRDLRDHVELLMGAGSAFDAEQFQRGDVTPVFFGSALNNFGLEPFLDALLEMAPAPGPRESDRGPIDPLDTTFTGFIFKIQANMDPKHRDRMAFLRVCSGRFEKDMTVHHARLNRSIRLSRAYRLFGRDREPIEEAFPGDVIGVVSPGHFAIGDTVSGGGPVRFPGIPRFAPGNFATLVNREIGRYKQFQKGLLQLEEEGATQVLYMEESHRKEPVLAVVGVLQFDVVLARLKEEYGVDANVERLPFTVARWVSGPEAALANISLPMQARRARDGKAQPVLLFNSTWDLDYCKENNPDLTFEEVSTT